MYSDFHLQFSGLPINHHISKLKQDRELVKKHIILSKEIELGMVVYLSGVEV